MAWGVIRTFLYFLIFVCLAAPLEFHLALYYGHSADAMLRGALYYFAVIVSIEALFRLATHPEVAGTLPIVGLRLLCAIPIAMFTLEVLPLAAHSGGVFSTEPRGQVAAAIIAIVGALIAHYVIVLIERGGKDLPMGEKL